MQASVGELKAGPCDQISERARHQYLAGPCRRHHLAGDVYGDSLHLLVSGLGLTGMQADTDRDTELGDRRHDRLGGTKRLRWLFERREEPISCCIHLSTTEPAKQPANRGVVTGVPAESVRTMRDTVPRAAVEGRATIERPPFE